MKKLPLTLSGTIVLLLLAALANAGQLSWQDCYTQASSLCRTGDWSNAYQHAKQAYTKACAEYGQDHLKTAKSLEQLGEICMAFGRMEQADLYLKKAIKISSIIQGKCGPGVVALVTRMADNHGFHRDYAEAEKLYKQALDLAVKGGRSESLHSAPALEGLARLYSDAGNYSSAEALYRQTIAIYDRNKSLTTAEKLSKARCLVNLADIEKARRKFDQAREHYVAAKELYSTAAGPYSPMIAYTYKRVADIYVEKDVPSIALTYFQRALGAYEATGLPEGALTAATLTGLAKLLKSQGKANSADDLYDEAIAIYERTGGLDRELATVSLSRESIWPSFSHK